MFMSLLCKETKLNTFTTEPTIARGEYVELKNNYFLHQELHCKKLLYLLVPKCGANL